ncbi:MAG: MBL fold metallo-hydrolase [Clostridia bacterium]|nr:MBL fold metallo-hydrolase [Clostridia bacterium]
MLKKFLCLLLATLAVMMCVTACDNNKPDDEETTPEDTSTQETTSKEEESSSEETTTDNEEESTSGEEDPEPTPTEFFPLVMQGTATATIVYPAEGLDYEKNAAEELADYIYDKSGTHPTVKEDTATLPTGTYMILIGDTALTDASLRRSELAIGHYVIQSIDNGLVVNGALEGGLLYAVDRIQEEITKHGISNEGKTLLLPDTALALDYAHPLREELFQCGNASMDLLDFCGENYYMLYFTGVKAADFSAYFNKLLSCGMESYEEPRAMLNTANNYYASCTDGDAVITMIGTHDERMRVFVEEKKDNGYFSYVNDNQTKVCDPLFFQVGTNAASGMGYIFRFANGDFFIVDGGFNDAEEPTRANCARIVEILKEYAPNPNDIHIVGWLITHPHIDHIGALEHFGNTYANDPTITLENILWNNYSTRILLEDEEQNLVPKLAVYTKAINKLVATGTKLHRTHVGQKFLFGDAEMEIVYTHELRMGYNKLTSGNGLSVISRFTVEGQTFLITGDTTTKSNQMMEAVYGTALQSDFYQTPHHGHGGNTTTLAGLVNPKWVLWPTDTENFNTRKEKAHNAFFFGDSHRVEQHFIAGSDTQIFSLPFNGTNVQVVPNKKSDGSLQQDTDGYYLITSMADLLLIAKDPAANYRLANDIRVSAGAVTVAGQTAWIGGSFTGILDGNGYTVDFTGTSFTYEKGGAVFFESIAGTVKNLTVKGVSITSIATAGCQQGVFASTCGNATFTNVHVTATVKQSTSHSVNLGAFVGKITKACTLTIEDCSTNMEITMIKGTVGGFVGSPAADNNKVIIRNSVSKGSINGGSGTVGGFIGKQAKGTATLENCTNEATLTGGTTGTYVGSATDPNSVTVKTGA